MFNLTPQPSINWAATELPDFPAPVEMDISCTECLTPDELAKECAPIAFFVIQQMFKQACAAERKTPLRPPSKLLKSLEHVRARLLYDLGYMSDAEKARRARASLVAGRPMSPATAKARVDAEAREMSRALNEQMFRRCCFCGETHDGSFTFGGIPVLECPEYPFGSEMPITLVPGETGTGRRVREEQEASGLAVAMREYIEDVKRAMMAHSATPPICAHCQRPSTELSYSLCPECIPCHSWFDGTGYVFEDYPPKNCTHLNRAQRRFICDVGTRYAYADGGKRLAELADADVPEPNGGTGANPDFAYSSESFDGPPFSAERYSPAEVQARYDIRSYSYGEWVCTNHPEGLEITYPADTPKCEVCGTPKG